MRLRRKPWVDDAFAKLDGEFVFTQDLDKFKGHWQEMFPGKRLGIDTWHTSWQRPFCRWYGTT